MYVSHGTPSYEKAYIANGTKYTIIVGLIHSWFTYIVYRNTAHHNNQQRVSYVTPVYAALADDGCYYPLPS